MARRRLLAGIITALCVLSGLRGRGASAVRWNGRSPNYRDAAFERWTSSEHEVQSRRYDGSDYDSSPYYYSTSAFSSNFSGPHHVHEPSTPLHRHSSRSHQSRRLHPQDDSRRRHPQPSGAARQNRGIEDQGEPAPSERASLIRPPSLQSIPLLQISKGR